ncbi:DUF1800 domain-containing protein [Bradyrhizobium sp.]|uniref:DUF1800 domain-containing protein n=1 Tax=Bradyrhizobium sp. TaxID=376 RepID=UPI003D0ECCE0
MARDSQAALVALNRFGFGARGGASGDFVNAASDPRGFVKAGLSRPNGVLLELPGLLSTPALAAAVFAYQAEIKLAREVAAKSGAAPSEAADAKENAKDNVKANVKALRRNLSLNSVAMEMSGKAPDIKEPDIKESGMATPDKAGANAAMQSTEAMQPNAATQPNTAKPPQPLNIIQKTFRAEALARLQRAMISDSGFVERLVVFWSNHFCISANKGELARIWAGSFEREAIRPHVLGRFGDMLKAVEQHPAMLFFLDNQQSLGPDSRAGQNRKRGLNENLAREIMELHTLGVGGGYTQNDVTSLARVITGWTFAGRQGELGTPGSFVFNANAHQPGAQLLLGKTYENNGVGQGEAALEDIARHPSTAKFIATKLVRHFVADDPPPALVARLQEVFRKSDGDLKALAAALVDSDEAWRAPPTKMRSPYEFLVASGRLLSQIPDDPGRYLGGLNLLGQPLWTPAGPNGFPDTNAAWAAPEGMKLRLDISAQMASRLGDAIDPRDLLELAAADAASPETRRTIERAESRQQALALLLMSPEFQRR